MSLKNHPILAIDTFALALFFSGTMAFAQEGSEPTEATQEPEEAYNTEVSESESEIISEIPETEIVSRISEGETEDETEDETEGEIEAEATELHESAHASDHRTMERSGSGGTSGSFLSRSHVRSALVEYRTAWGQGVGFLVHDRRTVLVMGSLRDRYRPITVRMHGSEGPDVRVASVELMEQEESAFVVLHLEGDLSGVPLEVSQERPSVGDSVYLVLRRGMSRRDGVIPDAIEVAEATVTAASTTSLTVGIAWSQIWRGSPLFDDAGRVVAFFGRESYAVRANEIFSQERLHNDRELLTPIVGIRIGTEFGGELIDPFLLEFDVGLALWDQLGIVFRLGVGFGEDVVATYVRTDDVHATAIADQRTVNIGLELKYRALLTRGAMPMYFDVVAGLNYTMTILDFHEIAIYHEADCDPWVQECEGEPGFASGRRTGHGVGPSFGFDLRAGLFTLGYRFIAEAISYQLNTAHRLTFGITFM